ncbi:MAG: SGNH/GDSL hydrolase family protein [Deltaproteobacteria bacterium]|nr:SGNH/GDSL hydrolase family protein [Deltaproteobacteria bacterium]
MTEPGGKTFPEILSSMEPGTAHVNAGVPGVGPDYYYLLVRNWTREVRVDLVVLHLFIGNDLDDIDSARSCADYGPLLEYGEATGEAAAPAGDSGQAGDSALSRAPGAGGGQVMPEARVRPRFGGPAWGSLLGSPLMASPPPYAVRVASGFSRAARVFQERYYRLAQATLNAQPEETRWEHLAAVLAATRDELRARGVPLVLVLMPHRPWLLDERFRVRGDGMRARIEKMASGLSVPVLVPWEDFEQAVQEQGLDRWFLGGVEDNHFSTAGHRWMADWLQPRLARLKSSTQ